MTTTEGGGDKAVGLPKGENKARRNLQLPTGFELGSQEVSEITRAVPSRVVVVAGPEGSGKTSLLTGIYEFIGSGRFGKLAFAGSSTLLGFERRCHPSRIASEREISETERTRSEPDPKLLHLRVRDQISGEHSDVLLTDVSGERFRLVAQSASECQKLGILRRADRLAVCLDGEALSKRATKAATITSGRLLVRSVLDAGVLPAGCGVQIVITKEDCLGEVEDESRSALEKRIQAEFLSRFGGKVDSIEFYTTSVRPLSTASGIEKLFSSWTESRPLPSPSLPASERGDREMDRFRAE